MMAACLAVLRAYHEVDMKVAMMVATTVSSRVVPRAPLMASHTV